MWKYRLSYDGGFLRDSEDLGYTFETEEEANEEAEAAVDEYIGDWELEGVTDTDRDLFEIEIAEV